MTYLASINVTLKAYHSLLKLLSKPLKDCEPHFENHWAISMPTYFSDREVGIKPKHMSQCKQKLVFPQQIHRSISTHSSSILYGSITKWLWPTV